MPGVRLQLDRQQLGSRRNALDVFLADLVELLLAGVALALLGEIDVEGNVVQSHRLEPPKELTAGVDAVGEEGGHQLLAHHIGHDLLELVVVS